MPAIGCESPWGYRNHMRFSVNWEGRPGLTARGSHRVLPLTACPLAHPRINDALALLAERPPCSPAGRDTLRRRDRPDAHPAPTHGGGVARLHVAGLDVRDETIEEDMGGARFRIRPSSFFQTNTTQANRMAALVLEYLPAGPDVTLVDAYCGVGAFARLLAARAGTVLAIEESASAIRDARWNLREAPNVEIIQAKVEDVLPGMARQLDGLVIDPPRAGCQRPVLDALDCPPRAACRLRLVQSRQPWRVTSLPSVCAATPMRSSRCSRWICSRRPPISKILPCWRLVQTV